MATLVRFENPLYHSFNTPAPFYGGISATDNWQNSMRDIFSGGFGQAGQQAGRHIASLVSRLAERLFPGGVYKGYNKSSGDAMSVAAPPDGQRVAYMGVGGQAGQVLYADEEGVPHRSSCVATYKFRPLAADMDITFRNGNGKVYTYHNVTPQVWEGWNKANSKGQFLNYVLKPNTWKLGAKPKSARKNKSAAFMRIFAENYDVTGKI